MSYEDMSDEEVVDMILESIEEDGRIKTEFINIDCQRGKPILAGRVASDEEIQILDEIMTEILDFDIYDNNTWVDDALAFESGDDDADEEEEDELEPDESFDGEEEEE